MPSSTSMRSRWVRMFLASPRLFWNSPKRRRPNRASRMIRSDHQSPITFSERAMGQPLFPRFVRFTIAGLLTGFSPRRRRIIALCSCIIKPPALVRQHSLMMQPPERKMGTRLANKTALITGGNSGIGLATARLFVAEGARVIITGRNQETLQAATKELGPNALAVVADATDITATEAAIRKGVDKFGKLDTVFANAGIPGNTPL